MKGNLERLPVYLDPDQHRTLRTKSTRDRRSMSAIVGEAIRLILREDEADLSAVSERAQEPVMAYEELLASLNEHGRT